MQCGEYYDVILFLMEDMIPYHKEMKVTDGTVDMLFRKIVQEELKIGKYDFGY